MPPTKPCQRCAECKHDEHHWMYNDWFGDFDDEEPDADPRYSHVCKHCDAIGSECPDCEGIGGDEDAECERCKGAGVILDWAALDSEGNPIS